MKKITIGVLILAIVIGGFIYFKNRNNNLVSESLPVVNSATYTNSKYNYQLTLPEGWRVLDESSDGQDLVITNSNNPSTDSMFGPDKIDISLTHLEPSYFSSIQEQNTSTKIIQKISVAQSYKGFLRVDMTPGKSGTVVAFGFNGNQTLTTGNNSGKTANALSILLSGAVNKDLLISLANSFVAK